MTEVDDEVGAPPAEEGEDGGANARSTTRWTAWLALVLLGALAAASGWGVQQRARANDAQEVVDRQREAVLVATGFVEALMSYDFEDLGRQQAAVETFATEAFGTDYAEAFTSDVRDQIVDEQASSTVTVRDVYVTVDGGDEVTAIVVAESNVSSARGATAQLESFLRVRLVRSDGRWQVDDLTSLGSRDRSVPLPRDEADG